MKKGIDVSNWQGLINWNKVKNAGVEFAILRIGYGMYDNQKDKQFENNYNGARTNGIPVGIYHYSYATSVEEAKKEAQLVLKWLNGRGLQLPVYFDLEDKTQQNLGKNTLNEMCRVFCNTIEDGGYWAGIYTNKYWATGLIDGPSLGDRYTYWIAQYNDKCTYAGDYAMWQYSSSGKVDGISGNVDMNYLYKDLGGSKGKSNNSTSNPSSNNNKKLYLPASASTWRVYPLNKKPVKGNECGLLKPSKFGGLEYHIIRYSQADVAVIQTRDFGQVQIYVAKSTGAVIK